MAFLPSLKNVDREIFVWNVQAVKKRRVSRADKVLNANLWVDDEPPPPPPNYRPRPQPTRFFSALGGESGASSGPASRRQVQGSTGGSRERGGTQDRSLSSRLRHSTSMDDLDMEDPSGSDAAFDDRDGP